MTFPALVESLKRLYQSGQIDIDVLERLKNEGKITQEQFDYIVSSVI